MQHLTPRQLADWLEDSTQNNPVLLDVREAWEIQTAALPGVVHIPMYDVPARLQELDADAAIVCICHHGVRSMQVAQFLEHHGCSQVFNLSGGMDAVSRSVYPHIPVY
jgi:rhodanese-related sulfurtransferase